MNTSVAGDEFRHTCREARLDAGLLECIAAIPELQEMPLERLLERAGPAYLLLVAESAAGIDGFKLGYPLSDTVFYSWLGGVRPDARRHGIARVLMRMQEQAAADRGYRTLRVKSMNRFPDMLRLLIAESYLIVGFDADSGKITFEKSLAGCAAAFPAAVSRV